MISCPSRPPRKWWIFKIALCHKYTITYMKWDSFFADWFIELECEYCGAITRNDFVSDDTLMRQWGKKKPPPHKKYRLGKSQIEDWLKD